MAKKGYAKHPVLSLDDGMGWDGRSYSRRCSKAFTSFQPVMRLLFIESQLCAGAVAVRFMLHRLESEAQARQVRL